MNAFIYHELISSSSPRQLDFRVERKLGWAFRKAYPAVCFSLMAFCGLVALSEQYPPQWSVGIAIGCAINLAAFPALLHFARKNRFTVLTVDEAHFQAHGRGVGKTPWLAATVNIPVTSIQWFGYVPSENRGLYLSQGFLENTCLLPGLDRAQTATVVDMITRSFPNLKSKTSPPR